MNGIIETYLPMAILLVSILAFVVSVLVEVTKNLPGFRNIPTDLEVLALSVVLSLLALFAYASYAGLVLTWYYIVVAILTGFFGAFISMFGWAKFTELWSRFKQ